TLSEATAGLSDRLEIEHRGLEAFLRFSLAHQNLYRVVMESQFVDEAVYREYYQTLADAYAANLTASQERGEVGRGDASAQAWALMGIAHFLGLRYAIWDKREPPEQVMATAREFISRGLAVGESAGCGEPQASAA